MNTGLEVGRFPASHDGPSHSVTITNASAHYPLEAIIRVDTSVLQRWNNEAYWPTMCIAFGLGVAFGFLLTKTRPRLEGPIADIDQALARHEFKPFFQPIFDLVSGEIVGCEVLARWVRRDGTVVSPINFIPLAESSGRIGPMTWQILSTALKDASHLLRENKNFRMSFNVAPRHLLSDGFIEALRDIVLEARVSSRQIVLEITERSELPSIEGAAAVVKQLRELGFRVAMDDVGVGNSGLSQMKGLGANTIKIDKFFVDTITEDEAAATIVAMLVRLARDLRMTVVAEGIETSEQIQALIACGVEEGQGYIVSPPLPFPNFSELLESRRSQALAEASVSAGCPGRIGLLLHHLAAQLASRIGGRVYVRIPFARDEVRHLRLGKYGRPLDRALRAFEREDDAGVFAGIARSMKVCGRRRPGQVFVGNGPRERFRSGVERGRRLAGCRTIVRWNFVGPLEFCLQDDCLGERCREAARGADKDQDRRNEYRVPGSWCSPSDCPAVTLTPAGAENFKMFGFRAAPA